MNKNLLLATGLIVLAVIVYKRKNAGYSNSCGACSGANGENWN